MLEDQQVAEEGGLESTEMGGGEREGKEYGTSRSKETNCRVFSPTKHWGNSTMKGFKKITKQNKIRYIHFYISETREGASGLLLTVLPKIFLKSNLLCTM